MTYFLFKSPQPFLSFSETNEQQLIFINKKIIVGFIYTTRPTDLTSSRIVYVSDKNLLKHLQHFTALAARPKSPFTGYNEMHSHKLQAFCFILHCKATLEDTGIFVKKKCSLEMKKYLLFGVKFLIKQVTQQRFCSSKG